MIAIGRQLFAERGFDATSVEEVAARAKVSKPVVYEHFGGKEGLYAVVVDREVRSLLDRIAAALTAGHPRELLEQAALALLALITQAGVYAVQRAHPPQGRMVEVSGATLHGAAWIRSWPSCIRRRWSGWWRWWVSGGGRRVSRGRRWWPPIW